MNPSSAPHDLFLDIFDGSPVLKLEPGEVLIHAGATADRVFNVLDGMVMVSRTGSDGRRQILTFLGRDNFVGRTSTNDYSFPVEAVLPTQVPVCPRAPLTTRLATRRPADQRRRQL